MGFYLKIKVEIVSAAMSETDLFLFLLAGCSVLPRRHAGVSAEDLGKIVARGKTGQFGNPGDLQAGGRKQMAGPFDLDSSNVVGG